MEEDEEKEAEWVRRCLTIERMRSRKGRILD